MSSPALVRPPLRLLDPPLQLLRAARQELNYEYTAEKWGSKLNDEYTAEKWR